jgi:hypothetical protein
MKVRRREVLKVVTSSVAAAAATQLRVRRASAESGKPIVRDVCVIGGGSAGTYTAVRLRDLGKSVVVLEKKGRLGGHAETVHAGPGNTPIDIGVIIFENIPFVTAYFGRFGVPLVPFPLAPSPTAYVDYRTGQPVNYTPPPPQAFGFALFTYLQVLQQQFPYLDAGFQLPSPVPDDLVRPFGDFVTKYGLDALVPTAFDFGQGLGNLLDDPALYVLKNFGLSVAGSLASNGFLLAPGGVGQLYDAAAQFLGGDVVFDATVTRVRREDDGVHVHAETPDGPRHVHCKKLVVAFPPTLFNLAPFDLDPFELATLGGFRANYYATGLVRVSGLPPGLVVQNVAANTRDNLPPLPGVYAIDPSPVDGLYNVKYGSAVWLPDDVVKANIAADLQRIAAAGTLPLTFGGFAAFSSHAPFEMMVSSEQIAQGFYSRLSSLQGRNDTFYTGAAFQTNDSSLIWRFTEGLLPKIVA